VNKYGKKGFLPFHCDFAKKTCPTTSFSLKFLCSIAKGTSDHSANHFSQGGKLLILQLLMVHFFVFIGNFLDFKSVLGPHHALKHSHRRALRDLREYKILVGGL
jgi:hypothetical protein